MKERDSDKKYIETISGRGYRLLPSVEELEPGIFPTLTADLFSNPNELRSIAILPFANKSGDSKFDYLAEGITQSLILNLSPLAQLKVISYSAVSRYQNRQVDLQEVGFLLEVDAILIGHIFEVDETLEIGVELIKVNNLSHLWGMQYQCKFEQFLKTRAEISVTIAEKLLSKLTKSELKKLTKQPTESSTAYKSYLKALNYAESKTEEGFMKAIFFFNESLDIDPNFALAYTGIAYSYINLGNFSLISVSEAVLNSQNAIKKALLLDDHLSEAHSANGLLQLYAADIENAGRSLKRSIELNPNSSLGYSTYSIYFLAIGDFQTALNYQYKAIELNPFIISRSGGLSTRFCIMREYSKAIKNSEEVAELFPNNGLSYFSLAFAYCHLKMFDFALKNVKMSYEIAKRPDTYALKGYIYALSGNEEKAFQILNEITNDSYNELIDFCDIAIIYGVLGNTNKAFEYLEKAYESKFSHLFLLKVDPRFDSLRSDPRFEPLLKRIGLE